MKCCKIKILLLLSGVFILTSCTDKSYDAYNDADVTNDYLETDQDINSAQNEYDLNPVDEQIKDDTSSLSDMDENTDDNDVNIFIPDCSDTFQNACNIPEAGRCSNDNIVERCKEDIRGCFVWKQVKICDDNLVCTGSGECVSEDAVLTIVLEKRVKNQLVVGGCLLQHNTALLPRIIDLQLTYNSNLQFVAQSAITGSVVDAAGKSLSVTQLDESNIRLVIQGFNSNTINSGKLFTLEFSLSEEGPYNVKIIEKEEMFSPPSADIALTLGGSVCIPECKNRMCGSDGCGNVCGSCSQNESCDKKGICNKISN